MVSTVAAVIAVIGAVLGLTGGLVGFIALPNFVRSRIVERTSLTEGSELYKAWENFPFPIVSKHYFFNVSNPEDVQKGAKPIVKEIGPYVYNQYLTKTNVTRKNEVLSYYRCQRFEFDANASAPLTETDEITVVNLPLMAMITMAEYNTGSHFYQMWILDRVIPTIFNNPSTVFLKTTPKEFLFDGVYLMCNTSDLASSIICNIMEYYAPPMLPRLEDGRFRFSIYGHKNNTCDEYYSINSGTTDIDKLGDVLAWQNHSILDIWGNDGVCNEISGSDGGLFSPFRTKQSVLKYFNTDVCRTVTVTYSESEDFSGVEVYRYDVDRTLFSSPSNYSENKCYCLDRAKGIRGEDGCLLDGVIELWECQGVPIIVSFPHFYLANEVYQNGVEGLKANKSLHKLFVDLDPLTGTVMRASKRGQANIFLRPIERIGLTNELSTTLMPVFWFDEHFQLPDEVVNQMVTELFDVLDILSIVKWSAVICGILLFTLGLTWVLRSMWGPQEFTKII